MNTIPKFFAESRETENSRLNKLSQMVTYLVCDRWKYRFKVLMSRVRQMTKDVIKSEV